MIDEDKLKSLLHDIVHDISDLLMPNHYKDQVVQEIHARIIKASLTKEEIDQ